MPNLTGSPCFALVAHLRVARNLLDVLDAVDVRDDLRQRTDRPISGESTSERSDRHDRPTDRPAKGRRFVWACSKGKKKKTLDRREETNSLFTGRALFFGGGVRRSHSTLLFLVLALTRKRERERERQIGSDRMRLLLCPRVGKNKVERNQQRAPERARNDQSKERGPHRAIRSERPVGKGPAFCVGMLERK